MGNVWYFTSAEAPKLIRENDFPTNAHTANDADSGVAMVRAKVEHPFRIF